MILKSKGALRNEWDHAEFTEPASEMPAEGSGKRGGTADTSVRGVRCSHRSLDCSFERRRRLADCGLVALGNPSAGQEVVESVEQLTGKDKGTWVTAGRLQQLLGGPGGAMIRLLLFTLLLLLLLLLLVLL
jgi:hypothetical protein